MVATAQTSRFPMAGDIGWLMNRLNQLRADRLRTLLEPLGLSARSAAMLTAVASLPQPVAQFEVCRALVLDQASVAIIADALQKDGLIERVRDARDRRRYAITLTEAGAELQRRCADMSRIAEDELVAGLPDGDIDTLRGLLTELATRRGII